MAANYTVLPHDPSSVPTDDGSCAGDPELRTFAVSGPTADFTGPFPTFSRHGELGHFSLEIDNNDRSSSTTTCTSSRSFVNNDKHLKHYYYKPSEESDLVLDLKKGFETFVKLDDNVKERLNNVMKWILHDHNKQHLPCVHDTDDMIESLGIDFIACRGHFTKFLCTPNENREGWKMAVTLFRKTIYISEVETEQDRKSWVEMSDWEKKCMYGGYKFEQYMTSDGKKAPDPSQPVNNIEAYFSVVCSDLKPYKLLYSAEVDCLQQGSTRNLTENYLELKTSGKWYTHKNEEEFFRYKLLKWWAQSFLVGIPEVICGFREKDGFIRKIEHFKTMQMPDLAQKNLTIPKSWDGSVCFNFLLKLLAFIKSVAVIDDPSMVYLFERKPGDPEKCVITYTEHKADGQEFIPEWYIDAFKKDSSAASAEAKAI